MPVRLNMNTVPKPVKSELTAAKLNSVDNERFSFGVLIMYLSNIYVSKRMGNTYTMNAQKIKKPARRKVTLTRKKYLGCTGG